MSILKSDSEVMRRHGDAIAAKSEFAQKIEEANHLLAVMGAQQQAFDELIAKSLNAVQESRALLLGLG